VSNPNPKVTVSLACGANEISPTLQA